MDTPKIDELRNVMDRLLGPDGCPWDKEQTHESLKQYLIEECYEVLDAIDKDDAAGMCEELGDVLLQVVFHAKLAEAAGRFTFDDVAEGVAQKMIHRHPHIFGEATARTAEAVLANWEQIKRAEKKHETVTDSIRAIPRNLPALMYAQKVVKKAGKVDTNSFSSEWAAEALEGMAKMLRAGKGGDVDSIMENYGSILLQLAYISAILQINPEFALTNAVETYINKFKDIEHTQAGVR